MEEIINVCVDGHVPFDYKDAVTNEYAILVLTYRLYNSLPSSTCISINCSPPPVGEIWRDYIMSGTIDEMKGELKKAKDAPFQYVAKFIQNKNIEPTEFVKAILYIKEVSPDT